MQSNDNMMITLRSFLLISKLQATQQNATTFLGNEYQPYSCSTKKLCSWERIPVYTLSFSPLDVTVLGMWCQGLGGLVKWTALGSCLLFCVILLLL